MRFPKVLIFGQPFNNYSGGGITLTNLFKNWPKDKIGVTFIGHGLFNVTTDVCDTYYQLGNEEHKWVFPFNLIQRKFKSGIKSFGNEEPKVPINFFQAGLRYKIVNSIFYPLLRWIGLSHSLSKISISEKFKKWLKEFQPEILYLQVSTRETILFAKDLYDFLHIPAVIHVMDDWPSTISRNGWFSKYWRRRIDSEFRQLLDRVDLHLSIGEAMSEEYLIRYHKIFIPFHNPIDTNRWLPYSKTNFAIDPEHVTILYSGRLGDNGIGDSLVEVATAIEAIASQNVKIKLHIQTPTKKRSTLERLRKFKCVVINQFVEYEKVPEVFSESDILLLSSDFSDSGVDYLRLSMPTKASEYMISGTPVLVYASDKTAVSRFFSTNNCGFCVTKQDNSELQKSILFLIEEEEYRKTVSHKAVNLAIEKFDAKNVRRKFQESLSDLIK